MQIEILSYCLIRKKRTCTGNRAFKGNYIKSGGNFADNINGNVTKHGFSIFFPPGVAVFAASKMLERVSKLVMRIRDNFDKYLDSNEKKPGFFNNWALPALVFIVLVALGFYTYLITPGGY